MLGIAQLCGAFTIISKPYEGEGFRARIRLYDFLKEGLDVDDEDFVKTNEIDVGEYTFEDYNPTDSRYGTLIIADDVHPTFIRSFKKSIEHKKFQEPPLDWSVALNIVSKFHSLQELGDYWRLLWELSASCPIPYVSDDALPEHLVVEEQMKLLDYKFKVIVDNIDLRKPVCLQNNPAGYTTHKIEIQNQKVYGKDLIFHGYIVVQEGTQLRPDELRGVLIRIKNVAIGYYDPSMLDYRINEGPRSRWLTGEIFVDQGLEDALNIDRDSFNKFHPEFRAIQEYVHKALQEVVFPKVYKQIEVRSKAKYEKKKEERTDKLRELISSAVEKPVVIYNDSQEISIDVMPHFDVIPHISVTEKEENVEIQLPAIETVKTKKVNRDLATAILTVYEIATLEKTIDRQREVFTKMILELLAGW